jgi:hypothetical protein
VCHSARERERERERELGREGEGERAQGAGLTSFEGVERLLNLPVNELAHFSDADRVVEEAQLKVYREEGFEKFRREREVGMENSPKFNAPTTHNNTHHTTRNQPLSTATTIIPNTSTGTERLTVGDQRTSCSLKKTMFNTSADTNPMSFLVSGPQTTGAQDQTTR